MGFLSGLPRSLSNLTGQSLRNLRQNRQKQETPLVRQNSDETNNKRQVFVPRTNRVPTTCLDNTPPPLPPRSTERPKRNPMSPMNPPSPMSSINSGSPVNPLAKPTPSMQNKMYKINPMHQSMPEDKFRRSSHSLDGEVDGPQPNSIALQMSYPLVNVPPPPLQVIFFWSSSKKKFFFFYKIFDLDQFSLRGFLKYFFLIFQGIWFFLVVHFVFVYNSSFTLQSRYCCSFLIIILLKSFFYFCGRCCWDTCFRIEY